MTTAHLFSDEAGRVFRAKARLADFDEPRCELPYRPSRLAFALACAVGFIIGWLAAAAGLPLP